MLLLCFFGSSDDGFAWWWRMSIMLLGSTLKILTYDVVVVSSILYS